MYIYTESAEFKKFAQEVEGYDHHKVKVETEHVNLMIRLTKRADERSGSDTTMKNQLVRLEQKLGVLQRRAETLGPVRAEKKKRAPKKRR